MKLLGYPADAAAEVFNGFPLLDRFGFGGDLYFLQGQFCLFVGVDQTEDLAGVIVTAEYFEIILGIREGVFRFVDLRLLLVEGGLTDFLGILCTGGLVLFVTGFAVTFFFGSEGIFGFGDRQFERIPLVDAFKTAVFSQGIICLREAFFRILEFCGVGTQKHAVIFTGQIQFFGQVVLFDFKVFNSFEQIVCFKFGEQIAFFDFGVFFDDPDEFCAMICLQCKFVFFAGVDVTALLKSDDQIIAADTESTIHIAAVV